MMMAVCCVRRMDGREADRGAYAAAEAVRLI